MTKRIGSKDIYEQLCEDMTLPWMGELTELVKLNLKDVRTSGPTLHLLQLLLRRDHNGELSSRAVDADGNEVKDLDTVVGLVKESEISIRPVLTAQERYGDVLSGVKVTLKNIFITINEDYSDDFKLFSMYGRGVFNPCIVMSYRGDIDVVLKLKASYTDLVKVVN